MKLNIYHRGKIEKTYETETHRVLYGTIRKISKISDSITVTASDDSEFYNSILKIIPSATEAIDDVLYELFPELTEEEITRTDIGEIALIIFELIKFQSVQIKAAFNGKTKN
ncbi:MAG: hypothetical protein U0K87_06810 [Ruminococcus sp.]|jgi:hypothetical protein|nr:hypothetical protein [Ruminococcus sp.]